MTPEARREGYARAFIAQARSDREVYELLERSSLAAVCHKFHYLQMFCEKLAKAYRVRDVNMDLKTVASTHNGFAKFIVPYIEINLRNEYRGKKAQLQVMIRNARTIAREIEKLAPAIDRIDSPENVEYPWERGDNIVAPCELRDFPSLSLLKDASGRNFLKLVDQALKNFR